MQQAKTNPGSLADIPGAHESYHLYRNRLSVTVSFTPRYVPTRQSASARRAQARCGAMDSHRTPSPVAHNFPSFTLQGHGVCHKIQRQLFPFQVKDSQDHTASPTVQYDHSTLTDTLSAIEPCSR